MVIDYSEMTEEQIAIINEYCNDDMRKLKQICYFVWGKKGLPTCYHDDLYDDAMNSPQSQKDAVGSIVSR